MALYEGREKVPELHRRIEGRGSEDLVVRLT